MGFNHQLYRISQFASLNTRRITEQIRDVVDSRCRILQTLEIYTCLGIGERGTLK